MRLLIVLILIASLTMPLFARGRCTGSAYCTACTTCSGCRHCAKEGGSCGVCSRSRPSRSSRPRPAPVRYPSFEKAPSDLERFIQAYYGLIDSKSLEEAYSWRTREAKVETSLQSFKEIWSSNRTIRIHKIGKARFNGSFYLVDVALDSLDVFKGKEQRAIYHGVLTLSQPSYGDWDDVRYHEFKVLRTDPMPLPTIALPKKRDPESRFIADELIKLKKLLDEGVLTQEEFDRQKAKLLSR